MSVKVEKINASTFLDIFLHTRKPRFTKIGTKNNPVNYCYACGSTGKFIFKNIINNDLANEWSLDDKKRNHFDIRESSSCTYCTSSLRSNLHAQTICNVLSPDSDNLADAMKKESFRKLTIAEINFCGGLHGVISTHPKLHYSEYIPKEKGIDHQDLNKLTYKTNFFDLVITSETLEHVPDWQKAFEEIRRVLKPGGVHIFTIPTILSRKTRERAFMKKDKVVNKLKPSHHGYNRGKSSDYLVFNEFGGDVRKRIDNIGYETFIYRTNLLDLSDPNIVFVSKKV